MKSLLQQYWAWLLVSVVPVVMFLCFYSDYLRNNTFFWVCLATLPLSVQRTSKKPGLFLPLVTMIIGLLSLLLPTHTGIYLFLSLMLVLMAQHLYGALQFTILFHVALTSPFFGYINGLVSFPVRLLLSRIVSFALQTIGLDVQIEGNLVYLNDSSFLIDEACAGMAMLGYGLLFGTIILAQLSKEKEIGWLWFTVFYVLLLALIFSGSIVRIALLIIFGIMPDHWLHEGVGLLVYAFQVLIPFYVIVGYILQKKPRKQNQIMPKHAWRPPLSYLLIFSLFLLVVLRHQLQEPSQSRTHPITLNGFSTEVVKSGVTKLQNDHTLIYIKPPVYPYRSDHDPRICWQGSGYSFKKIDQWNFDDTLVN
ncbi:MAG: exosortase N [Bacteroidota bacterium]